MAMSGEKRLPAHICFITETPIGDVAAHLETCGVPVRMQGPRVRRNRHDPIGLYRRPGPKFDRDFHLLSRVTPTLTPPRSAREGYDASSTKPLSRTAGEGGPGPRGRGLD